MLVIRQSQFNVFEQLRRQRLEERAMKMLCEVFGLESDSKACSMLVNRIWKKARRYGITNEYDVLLFVGLAHTYGIDFDHDPRRPWIAELLENPKVCPRSKLRVLRVRLAREAEQVEEGREVVS